VWKITKENVTFASAFRDPSSKDCKQSNSMQTRALLNLDKKYCKIFLRAKQLPVKGTIDKRCHSLEAVPERRAIHKLNAYFFLQKTKSECKYIGLINGPYFGLKIWRQSVIKCWTFVNSCCLWSYTSITIIWCIFKVKNEHNHHNLYMYVLDMNISHVWSPSFSFEAITFASGTFVSHHVIWWASHNLKKIKQKNIITINVNELSIQFLDVGKIFHKECCEPIKQKRVLWA